MSYFEYGPYLRVRADIEGLVRSVVAEAAEHGFVVTVEQRPLKPLAMGHYETVVAVRERVDHKALAAERGGYAPQLDTRRCVCCLINPAVYYGACRACAPSLHPSLYP